MLKTEKIIYHHENVVLEGFYALDDKFQGQRPAVLVAHDWSGRNDFAHKKAEKLAELGYVGFALDMFGQGILGQNNEEKKQLISPFVQDRGFLLQRILAAFETLTGLPQVDTARLGAIGFCFGGLCVLDLARSGVDLCGVVSFHGLLGSPDNQSAKPIKAKILVAHGHDDPMVPPEQVLAFETEMTKAKADWQVHVYGNTMHGFTNPVAHDPGFGTVYNKLAEQRSWIAMQNFFHEFFAK